MKTAKLSDILGIINKLAPPELAESWDNSGLQVGNPGAEIKRIMVALEPTIAVIESAINNSCQLLLTHHPLIFKPQSSLSTATPLGKAIHIAIAGGLSVVSMHTNYDTAAGGLNDILAKQIGLSATAPLKTGFNQELVKLVIFVPATHLESVRAALFPFILSSGDYKDCSFCTQGEGTFTPGLSAQPFIGNSGIFEKVAEQRLELLLDRTMLSKALHKLQGIHPYEEPVYDIYPLLNQGEKLGLGRIGKLENSQTLYKYAQYVAQQLETKTVRYVGNPDKIITKIALCSGSGTSLIREAVRGGADVLVTGDVKYHDARDAEALGLALIDAGHFGTEIIMARAVQKQLQQQLFDRGYTSCEVTTCKVEYDPFILLNTSKIIF